MRNRNWDQAGLVGDSSPERTANRQNVLGAIIVTIDLCCVPWLRGSLQIGTRRLLNLRGSQTQVKPRHYRRRILGVQYQKWWPVACALCTSRSPQRRKRTASWCTSSGCIWWYCAPKQLLLESWSQSILVGERHIAGKKKHRRSPGYKLGITRINGLLKKTKPIQKLCFFGCLTFWLTIRYASYNAYALRFPTKIFERLFHSITLKKM